MGPCAYMEPLAMTPEVNLTGDGEPKATLTSRWLVHPGPKEIAPTRSCLDEVWVLAEKRGIEALHLFGRRRRVSNSEVCNTVVTEGGALPLQ